MMKSSGWFLALVGLFSWVGVSLTSAATEPYWNWRNPLPQGNDYNGVAYGKGRFVAVGAAGTITTSSDGVSWTAANSRVNHGLACVAFGNSRFVAKGYVSGASGLLISDDGLAWRAPDASLPSGWRSVSLITYAGDRFFAMSNSAFEAKINVHLVATSTDGVTWTTSDSATAIKAGRIAHGGGIYLGQDMLTGDLSSTDGVTWTYTEVKIVRSSDGVTWTTGGGTGLASLSAGPVYYDGRWVVAGLLDTTVAGGAQRFNRALSVSTDGGLTWAVTWNDANSGWMGNSPIAGMVGFGGRLILLGDPNVPVLSTADLTTVRLDMPTQMIILNQAVATADRVVAVGRYGRIQSTSDGTNWTSPTTSAVGGNLRGAAFGDGRWIVAGDTGLVGSPDGIAWQMLSAAPAYPEGSVAYGNGRFVVGASDGHTHVSIDRGVTWTDAGAVGVHGRLVFAQGRFIASSGLRTSTDGLTWSDSVSPPGGTGVWTGVFLVDGVLYAMGTTDPKQEKDGVIARSLDGVNWTVVASMPEMLTTIGGKSDLLVASGYIGQIWTSTDGVTWTKAGGNPLMSYGPAAGVLWVGASLVAVTYSGQVVTSDDGVAWTKDEFASSGTMFAMAAGNGQVLALGNGGAIWEVGAARFTSQPSGRTVAAGASVTFSVGVTGKEPLTYEWFKDGALVGGSVRNAFTGSARRTAISGRNGRTLTLSSVSAADAGSYRVVVTNGFGSTESATATLIVAASVTAPAIAAQPESKSVNIGATVTFAVSATGDSLSYQWRKEGVAIGGATGSSYTLPSAAVTDSGTYSVIVSNSAGSVTSRDATLVVSRAVAPPSIVTAPEAKTVRAGEPVTLTVTAAGDGALSYQWRKDGVAIAGATGSSYTLSAVTSADGGAYTVVVTNGAGSVTSGEVALKVLAARLVNISARAYATTNNGVTIGGFVITGSEPKQVLIRAVGPSLAQWGLAAGEVLADPIVELHHGEVTLAVNDNWGDNANAADITAAAARVGAGALVGSDTRSAAMLTTLNPGVYSFIAKGKNETSGIVLLEIYDADSGAAQFTNISARAYATTNNGVTIGGFVITGNVAKRVLLRAVGPTLASYGLAASEVLRDPLMELHRGSDTVAVNNNWGDNDNAAEIVSLGAGIGATPLDQSDTKSAAMLRTLEPGAYSFIVKGVNDTSGLVLVEVYAAD